MFINIDTDKVPVTDGSGNCIFIKPRMTFGMQNELAAAGMLDRMQAVNALYEAFIVSWQGPAFKDEHNRDLPCTSENIQRLDPDNPLVTKLREEVMRRAETKKPPDPTIASTSGPTTGGSEPLAQSPILEYPTTASNSNGYVYSLNDADGQK